MQEAVEQQKNVIFVEPIQDLTSKNCNSFDFGTIRTEKGISTTHKKSANIAGGEIHHFSSFLLKWRVFKNNLICTYRKSVIGKSGT